MRLRLLPVVLVAVVAPLVLLAPVGPLAGLGADEDDILYYYPSRVQIARFMEAGEPPWLSPWNGLGRPFLADPQSAVFYPPTWLFAVLPPTIAYGLNLWLHYTLAVLGAFALFRAQRAAVLAAAFGGVVFALSGFMVAHRAHLTMICAAAWMPIVLLLLERAAQRGTPRSIAAAAGVIALQMFAGHVQIAALTALSSAVYLIGSEGRTLVVLRRWMLCWALAALLFSVQWMPTLAYLSLSTRADRGYAGFVENSWNPIAAAGLVLPMALGQRTPNFFDTPYWGPSHQVEQFAYAGILPLLLALAAWRLPVTRASPVARLRRMLVFSVLLALGLYGPICPLLYWVPGASVFRVPARALLPAGLALAGLAAHALTALRAPPDAANVQLRAVLQRWTARPFLLAGAALGVPLLMLALTALAAPENVERVGLHALRPTAPAVWVPALVVGLTIAAVWVCARSWGRPALWGVPLLIAMADLAVIGWTLDVPAGRTRAAEWLDADRHRPWTAKVEEGSGRLWVVTTRDFSRAALGNAWGTPGEYVAPRATASPNVNALDRIPALNDYGPLQPRPFVARFGFHPWGETDRARELLAEGEWMRAYNVGWLLLCDPSLPLPPGATVAWSAGGLRLVRTGRAAGELLGSDLRPPAGVSVESSRPHSLVARVEALEDAGAPPRRVIVSRMALPGWKATLDDVALPIGWFDECLMELAIPLDAHGTLTMSYSPPGLARGAALSLGGVALLLLLTRMRPRREPPATPR